MNTNISTIFAS